MVKKKATTKAGTKAKDTKSRELVIKPPNFQIAEFRIRGTAPYVQNKFSAKSQAIMKTRQEEGAAGQNKRERKPKEFVALYKDAMHVSTKGWCGIPASAFRCAMISACRIAGYAMTKAKISVFVIADGVDADDGAPLVKITKGKPEYFESRVRNDDGSCDIRPRPLWQPGWEAIVRVQFDAGQFSLEDVGNLLVRAGIQVAVGEGRFDSKKSNGMGWGTFEVLGK